MIGWVSGGPIGALIGILVGSVIEGGFGIAGRLGAAREEGYRNVGSGYANRGGYRSYSAAEQRNSFMVSLLVLSSAIIRADGRTLQAELDCVKDFIRRNFGEQAVPEAMRLLQELEKKNIICNYFIIWLR